MPSLNHIRHFIKIPFINKGIEFIDLPGIFWANNVISAILSYFENTESPIICYKYNKPIHNTILNFNKLVPDLDIETSSPNSWDCKDSKFCYQPEGHIVSGNLKIITDSWIRSVISKGLKYRFPAHIDFNKCRKTIASALNDYCTCWCKREHVESNALNNWKLKIFKIIDERVLFYSNNLDFLPPKPKLSFWYLKQGIQEFHRKYVLAPAHKAANNVVVVWWLHYINTLIQELGSTKTYKQISTDERSIVNAHCIEITAKFAVSIKEKQDRLPMLYWLLKLHKRPYKARFTANSSSCTTTVLSKLLTSCHTAVKKHWIGYYDTVYKRDEINYFWSIKNSNEVLYKFKSKNFKASKLSTYDFSTLYTTLPHHLIKDKLIDLINQTFIPENTQYLARNKECAFFTSDVYNNYNLWSCQKVCDALVYLLDNIFIRFGTKLYRQTIGILVGIIVLLLLQIGFFFVMREISWSLMGKSGWHFGGTVGCTSDWRPRGHGFDPCRGRQHSFVEIDHEIFSTVILSLPLIQEGQLSVSGERMYTILVNRLED